MHHPAHKLLQVEIIPDAVLRLFNDGAFVDQQTKNWALGSISRDMAHPQAVNFKSKDQEFIYHRSGIAGAGVTIYILDGGMGTHEVRVL